MLRLVTPIMLWALAVLPAAAQPGPPPPTGRLFISPAGEPFRGGGGRETWFARADNDHDQALTLAEFRADALTFFKVVDANGDGVIVDGENRAYETKIAPEILGYDPQDEAPPPRRPRRGDEGSASLIPPGGGARGLAPREGAARFGLLNEPQPVRGADGDLNWKITTEEWAKAAGKRFALLDRDGDGKLTLATLPGARR